MDKQVSKTKFGVTKEGVNYEFEAAEEGGYVVSVPLYPSCATQGETFEEALKNIEDALIECLSAAQELNLPIPKELEHVLRQPIKH
jgi:predicted RNase H-like HicB family nuclease